MRHDATRHPGPAKPTQATQLELGAKFPRRAGKPSPAGAWYL